MSHTIISARTGAVATETSIQISHVPATLFATGLAAAEECDLYISPDSGATWVDYGTLTAGTPLVVIQGPMLLGVLKDATVAAGGVYLADANNI